MMAAVGVRSKSTLNTLRCSFDFKTQEKNGAWWLKPIILATQEGEIRRIVF
jgi:hypothetical protein